MEESNWLNSISLATIPTRRKKKKTIMDIAGIDHLETKWSSIYAYFFDPNEAHGLGTLFYDSLSDIILQKCSDKKLQLNDFSVEVEVPAKDKEGTTKFIDILLTDGEYAVIIENKVYAHLYNPLETYWDSIEIEQEKKCGVVLSLNKINAEKHNPNFINITHEKLIKQIEKNLFKHYHKAEPKSLLFLQDFIQNIYNLKNMIDDSILKFYYKGDNHLKINKLVQTRNDIINGLSEQIENDNMNRLLEQSGFRLEIRKKKSNRYTYYAFKDCNQAMITLIYDTLWNFENNGCRVRAILEFQGEIKVWLEGKQSTIFQKANPDLTKTKYYWHYISEDWLFPNPAIELGDGFQQRICEKLENGNVYKIGNEIVKQFVAQKK